MRITDDSMRKLCSRLTPAAPGAQPSANSSGKYTAPRRAAANRLWASLSAVRVVVIEEVPTNYTLYLVKRHADRFPNRLTFPAAKLLFFTDTATFKLPEDVLNPRNRTHRELRDLTRNRCENLSRLLSPTHLCLNVSNVLYYSQFEVTACLSNMYSKWSFRPNVWVRNSSHDYYLLAAAHNKLGDVWLGYCKSRVDSAEDEDSDWYVFCS